MKCSKCSQYTIKDKCPKCNLKTINPKPPTYGPEDRYGDYRRKVKREIYKGDGLL